jgi:hypothetical protein
MFPHFLCVVQHGVQMVFKMVFKSIKFCLVNSMVSPIVEPSSKLCGIDEEQQVDVRLRND